MTVAFLGTKGGTGTTTMMVNIGAGLCRVTGQAAVLVDLKPAPGDVALFLGLRPRQTLTQLLAHLAWTDPSSLRSYLSSHSCGVDVLPAGDEWGRPGSRDIEAVQAAVEALQAIYPIVVLDMGSTLTAATAGALEAADLVILVANPDVACLRNLQRLIDAVRLEGVPADRLRLLLNRTSDESAVSVAQISDVLGLPIDWSVPSDYRAVNAAVTSGVPVRALRASSDLQRHLESIVRTLAEDWGPASASASLATVAPLDDSAASQ